MATLVSRDTSGVLQAQHGEREDLRTRSAKRWLVGTLPDGRKQYRVGASIGPIHYRTDPFDEAEPWKEIDLTIRPVTGKGWQWEVNDNGYQVRIWQRYMMPWHYTAEFRRAGEWVRMAPVELRYTNAAGERQTIATPTKGLVPVIDNDAYTVTWQDCFGKGLHFRYNITPDQFAKTVVIDAPDALPAATIAGEGLRVEVVMALAWSGQAGNGFGRGRDLTVLRGPEDDEEERQERFGKHPHLRGDGLAALWMAEPRAWDADGETLPMQWGLERKGRRVFGAFGVEVAALAGAAWPVCVDTAIDEEQVGASSDDARAMSTTNPWFLTGQTEFISNLTSATFIGMRWATVPIPNGATIDSASFSVYVTSTIADDIHSDIHGHDADDSPTFNNTTDTYSGRDKTTATISWVEDALEVGFAASPDIKAIVSEIISRAGWASGNSLSILSSGTPVSFKRCQIYMYDYPGNVSGPKFNCTYTAGGAAGNPLWYYNMLRRAN